MADNVAITAGSGTTVATDDVAGVHYQRMKLVNGTLDATDAIGGDATNGLDVDVTRVIPGTGATNLGKAEDVASVDGDTGVMALGVREYTGAGTDGDYSAFSVAADGIQRVKSHKDQVETSVTSAGLTIATTAYTTNDTVGTLFTITGMARLTGGTGVITNVRLIDAADIIGAVDVVFFTTAVTLAADNAAFAISDADALNCIGIVPLAGAYDIGNNRVGQSGPTALPYTTSGGTSIYAGLITRSPHTFFAAVGNLQLIVTSERN